MSESVAGDIAIGIVSEGAATAEGAVDLARAYDPTDWYWVVAGDETRAWSSSDGAYVAADEARYAAWRARGLSPNRIANEFELDLVLRRSGLSIGRALTAGEALEALTLIDAAQVTKALGRADISSIEAGDVDKLSAAAIALGAGWPEIEGAFKPKSAEAAIADLEARFATLEAELVEKGVLASS